MSQSKTTTSESIQTQKSSSIKLIVLTSTLPRWDDDSVPSFVLDHAKLLRERTDSVLVIAPHALGAKKSEIVDGVRIKRVRYWWSEKAQDIFYDGGAGEKTKNTPNYYLKVILYMISVLLVVVKERPNNETVVNANWVVPQGLIGVVVKVLYPKAKLVTTARGGDIYTLNSSLMVKLKRLVLRRSDSVVVNSHDMAKRCTDIYKREYIVQPTGFDDTKLKKKSPARYRKQISAPLKLITAGRLVEGKGFLDILEAVKQVNSRDQKKGVRLSVAGEGPLKDKIESYVRENNMEGCVHMMGWLSAEQMREAYCVADAYIGAPRVGSDGRKEAFGNVYAESMACGTPAIVTTDAGASEIMTNMVSGLIIEPGNIDELARAICYLRDNPNKAKKMGQAAAVAVAPYSKIATRDKYIEIINELQK